jgi:hypothetical protein
VIAQSGNVLAELGDDAAAHRWGPGVVARLGMAHARFQQYPAARPELERALAALPGSDAEADLGAGEVVSLHLLEVLVAVGDLGQAMALAGRLYEQASHPAIRTAASRTLARLHLAGGDAVAAHRWLDAAADLAARTGGDLPLALVHAERAVVVAGDSRPHEAVAMAVEAAGRLAAARGPVAGLARETAALAAAAVALAVCDDHPEGASRLAQRASSLATVPHRPVTAAIVELSRIAVAHRLRRAPEHPGSDTPGEDTSGDDLEARAEAVVAALSAAGAEPARALAVREQALLAAGNGHQASAVALARHALWAFDQLELPVETARCRGVLLALSA